MAKASISVVKGKGSLNHNNREFVTDNVDRDRIKDNIVYKCESLEDAYRHCFEQAIAEYNAKQKGQTGALTESVGTWNRYEPLKMAKNSFMRT